jgi:nucleoid-associated protein YgaU
MRKPIITILAIAVLGLAAASLPAQSLLDNSYYKMAVTLKAQSDAALAAGDYDGAASLAADAEENFKKSDEYVEEMLNRYRANGWLQQANEQLAQAKAAGKDKSAKDLYDEAADSIDNAKTCYDVANYLDSVEFSKLAITTLASIPGVEPVAVVEPVVTPVVEPVEPGTPELPATYTVRLIPERRDCLWRIAEYPFVYNDPWKWKVLYEANRGILIEPDNPDLIEVDQVLTIPSIAGETREGEWDPSLDYPVFGAD